MNQLLRTMINRILTHDQIQHITKRIAYQIYETNVDEEEIVVAGINGGGESFDQKNNSCPKKDYGGQDYFVQSGHGQKEPIEKWGQHLAFGGRIQKQINCFGG